MSAPEQEGLFAGRWIGQRECSWCGFNGPETEFLAVGVIEPGEAIVIVHRDDATEKMVLVCCGCAAHLGRWDHEALRRAIVCLIERGASV